MVFPFFFFASGSEVVFTVSTDSDEARPLGRFVAQAFPGGSSHDRFPRQDSNPLSLIDTAGGGAPNVGARLPHKSMGNRTPRFPKK
jgi:hypothetical protein